MRKKKGKTFKGCGQKRVNVIEHKKDVSTELLTMLKSGWMLGGSGKIS